MKISILNLNFYLLNLCICMHTCMCLSICIYTMCAIACRGQKRRALASGGGHDGDDTSPLHCWAISPPAFPFLCFSILSPPNTILNEWAAASFDPQDTVCQLYLLTNMALSTQLYWPNMGTQKSTFSMNSPGHWNAQTHKQVSGSLRSAPQSLLNKDRCSMWRDSITEAEQGLPDHPPVLFPNDIFQYISITHNIFRLQQKLCQEWWHMPVAPALWRQRQENGCKCKANLA